MAQEVQGATSCNVVINKALLNNTFESYKLHFDYVIEPIADDKADEKDASSDPNSDCRSTSIRLPHAHLPVKLKQQIANEARLEHIMRRNYLVLVNGLLFYYDTTHIFIVDIAGNSTHRIHEFGAPKQNTAANTSFKVQ